MRTPKIATQQVGRTERIGMFFAGWLAVLQFGGIVAIVSALLAVTLVDTDTDIGAARAVLIGALIAGAIYGLTIIVVWRHRRHLFAHYSLQALWTGLGVIGLVGLLALIGIGLLKSQGVTSSSSHPSSGTALQSTTCTTPKQQLQAAGDAIIPIDTDLGSGTGFAIDDQGYVVTAYHVIKGASQLYSNYDTGRVALQVVKTAPDYDLALLKIATPPKHHFNLTANYSLLDDVYVYGYPGNAFTAGGPSVSEGIISRVLSTSDLRLNGPGVPAGLEILQTDAAINGGNSGGPMVNGCGVVGVVQSTSDSSGLYKYIGIGSEEGIGYATSSKTIATVLELPISTNKTTDSMTTDQ